MFLGRARWASQMVLVVKNLPANAGDVRDKGSIPGLGRSPGEVHGNPLQYSSLKNPMNRGPWWVTVHRVAKSQVVMASLWKGCVTLFYSQLSRDKLSLYELNKGTLVCSETEGQGPLREAIKCDYNNKSNEKKVKETIPTWSQNWLPPWNMILNILTSISPSSLPSQKCFPASSSAIHHQILNSSLGKYNNLSLHFTLYTTPVSIVSNCCLLLIYIYLYYLVIIVSVSPSVVSNSLWPCGL